MNPLTLIIVVYVAVSISCAAGLALLAWAQHGERKVS